MLEVKTDADVILLCGHWVDPDLDREKAWIWIRKQGWALIWIRLKSEHTNLNARYFSLQGEQKSHVPGFFWHYFVEMITFFSQVGAEACFRSPFPDGGASVEVHKVSRIFFTTFWFWVEYGTFLRNRELAMEVSFPFLYYVSRLASAFFKHWLSK